MKGHSNLILCFHSFLEEGIKEEGRHPNLRFFNAKSINPVFLFESIPIILNNRFQIIS